MIVANFVACNKMLWIIWIYEDGGYNFIFDWFII